MPAQHVVVHIRTQPYRLNSRPSRSRLVGVLLGAAVAVSGIVPHDAHAVDGCRALLCLAAPSWRDIPECVPTIQQLLRDLARGKPFPICGMSGGGNSAGNQWTSAPVTAGRILPNSTG